MNNIEKSAQLLFDDEDFINDVKKHIHNISNDNKILHEQCYAAASLCPVSQPSIACLRATPHI